MISEAKSCIVIQCRYDSSRLPGKILREIGHGKTCLDLILDQVRSMGLPVVVATSTRPEDDPIAWHISSNTKYLDMKLYLHRGSYDNIAQRLYEATSGYDYIVRVTGDDVFVDPVVLGTTLSAAIMNGYDYTYQPNMVRGFDCEVFRRDAIFKVMVKYAGEKIEHLEHYLKTPGFKVGKVMVPHLMDDRVSLTIDTEQDLWVAKQAYEAGPEEPNSEQLMRYVAESGIYKYNQKPKITVYMVYKDYDIRWLESSLSAVGRQGLDFEFIFVDYSTSDICAGLAKRTLFDHNWVFMKKHKYFRKPEITNFIDAISFAISQASGKYVIRADADDIMYPGCVQGLYDCANQFDAGIVIPDYATGDPDSRHPSLANGAGQNLTCHAIIEKKKYDFIKYIDGQEFRDGVSLIETFKKYDFPIRYLHVPLFWHREHDNSLTADQEKVKEMDETIKQFNIRSM